VDVQNKQLNQPLSGNAMPRFAGPATMMRLPMTDRVEELDACFVGVPFDIGTSNRAGARFGPRQIRAESAFLRPYNLATHAAPFDSLNVADFGDVATSPYSIEMSVAAIETAFRRIVEADCRPLTMGGDHTIALPILRAMHAKYGPVALVHVDAHGDTDEGKFGAKINHGTPFRCAFEEGLIDSHRVFQIGLRGTGYGPEDLDWSRERGFRVVPAEECWYHSLAPLMTEVREVIGDRPVHLSFDIDGLDPAFAPGTGTPEIGGLTVPQGLEIIRGMKGLNVVGADLVEVSPPYDTSGNTALLAANLLFEMLCVLPGVVRR
jgi:guanidinobutyrase